MITFRSRDDGGDCEDERPLLRLLRPHRDAEAAPRRETRPEQPTYRRLEEN